LLRTLLLLQSPPPPLVLLPPPLLLLPLLLLLFQHLPIIHSLPPSPSPACLPACLMSRPLVVIKDTTACTHREQERRTRIAGVHDAGVHDALGSRHVHIDGRTHAASSRWKSAAQFSPRSNHRCAARDAVSTGTEKRPTLTG
jgi:hypothetical protein